MQWHVAGSVPRTYYIQLPTVELIERTHSSVTAHKTVLLHIAHTLEYHTFLCDSTHLGPARVFLQGFSISMVHAEVNPQRWHLTTCQNQGYHATTTILPDRL
ncbi:MAG: hypothetical protein ACRDHZ_03960 [Ktedonobacteraceae bacterium]